MCLFNVLIGHPSISISKAVLVKSDKANNNNNNFSIYTFPIWLGGLSPSGRLQQNGRQQQDKNISLS